MDTHHINAVKNANWGWFTWTGFVVTGSLIGIGIGLTIYL